MTLPASIPASAQRRLRFAWPFIAAAIGCTLLPLAENNLAIAQSPENRKYTTYLTITNVAELNTFKGVGNRILFLDSCSSIDAQAFHDTLNNYTKQDQHADKLLVGIIDVASMERGDHHKMLEALDALRRNSDRIDGGGLRQPRGASQLIYFQNGDVLGSTWCAAIRSLADFRDINRRAFSKTPITVDASSDQK